MGCIYNNCKKQLKQDLKETPNKSTSLFFNSISEKVITLYNSLDIDEQFKFVCKDGFDLIRLTRRCGKDHHKAISELIKSNTIFLIKGRLLECKKEKKNSFLLKYKTESKKIKEEALSICKKINCTGFENLNTTSNTLIYNLLKRKLISVNQSSRGFKLDKHFQSTKTKNLYVMGPLLSGFFNTNFKLWYVESNSRILFLSEILANSIIDNFLH
ncbi:MAG: hypothetical protein CBC02_011505 [Flavobacteriaceae bacterium TMED42]|nr:MAG: hypothetical protein CBC02_011505 [Flavobacteriaceae bacterium TMED42]